MAEAIRFHANESCDLFVTDSQKRYLNHLSCSKVAISYYYLTQIDEIAITRTKEEDISRKLPIGLVSEQASDRDSH
jgi:hypothetical protein